MIFFVWNFVHPTLRDFIPEFRNRNYAFLPFPFLMCSIIIIIDMKYKLVWHYLKSSEHDWG